jgi:hypothetical protein
MTPHEAMSHAMNPASQRTERITVWNWRREADPEEPYDDGAMVRIIHYSNPNPGAAPYRAEMASGGIIDMVGCATARKALEEFRRFVVAESADTTRIDAALSALVEP